MALPKSLQTLRLTNATTGDQVDDKIAALESDIADILGLPLDTPITRPMIGSLVGSSAEPNISSTVAQTSVYATTIPGGTLGTDGMLEGWCDLHINSILSGGVLEIRTIYGPQLIVGIQLNNLTLVNQTSAPLRLNFRLCARNSVTAQRAFQTSSIGTQQNNFCWGGQSFSWNYHSSTFLTVDSAIDQPFQIDVIWNTASAGNSINGEGFEIHRLR